MSVCAIAGWIGFTFGVFSVIISLRNLTLVKREVAAYRAARRDFENARARIKEFVP
ncbi:MAG: hypothetical protein WCB99_14420 [Candidatus Cybelea sp.]